MQSLADFSLIAFPRDDVISEQFWCNCLTWGPGWEQIGYHQVKQATIKKRETWGERRGMVCSEAQNCVDVALSLIEINNDCRISQPGKARSNVNRRSRARTAATFGQIYGNTVRAYRANRCVNHFGCQVMTTIRAIRANPRNGVV